MKRLIFLSIVLGLTAPLLAQGLEPRDGGGWVGHNGFVERGETRVAFFSDHPRGLAQGRAAVEGELMINFGRPHWKPGYETKLDEMTLGKVWRLGSDFWTILDTNLDLNIGGQKIPAGYYYLAVQRRQASSWELLLLDPARARRLLLDPFEVVVPSRKTAKGLPVAYSIPLKFQQGSGVEERLRISLKPSVEGSRTRVTMTIAWGDLRLATILEPETTS